MMREYELLVFDWDGTIADSESRIVSSVQAAVSELGLPARTPQQIREIIGLGMRESMQVLFPEYPPDSHEEFIQAYRINWRSQAVAPVDLFPEVREVLASLDSRGYLLAVATGKGRRGLDRELAESGLAHLIAASRCADEAPSKPHPKMLEDVLEMTAISPKKALMIGDTTYDMQMARDAGVDRVAVSYGAHEQSRLLEFEPLTVIDSFRVLEDWLARPVLDVR